MTTPPGTACPFCHPAPERIVFENPLVIALWDAFPVNRGHALIVPRRHVPAWPTPPLNEKCPKVNQ